MNPQRIELFRRHNGICLWCEQPTRLVCERINGDAPKDMATIDHLIHSAYRPHQLQYAKVLACYFCNQNRNWTEAAIAYDPVAKKEQTIQLLTIDEMNSLIQIYKNWKIKRSRTISMSTRQEIARASAFLANRQRYQRSETIREFAKVSLLTVDQHATLMDAYHECDHCSAIED